MSSERKAFCEYIKNEYNDYNPIEWLDGKPIKGLHLMLWNAWQASVQRQGYKLVPVEPSERMQEIGMEFIPTIDCQPYDAGMVYKAMIGAVDE